MYDYFLSFGSLNWFIGAGILLALEIAAPGAFMLWLGVAALLVGVLSLVIDWPWHFQFAAFAVFALAAIPLYRGIARRVEEPNEHPFLNRRADEFVGRVFTIDKPIVNTSGTIRVNDTVWRVVGPDSPAGSRVRVVSVDGVELQVERAMD